MRTEQWFEKAMAYFSGAMTAKEDQLFEEEIDDAWDLLRNQCHHFYN